MKVSIITVTYNCESTIEDTILSVANQDYSDIEHIIIDGASTDKTMEVIAKHKDNLQHITSESDGGPYHAMNKGIKCANGEIVGILNGDDAYYDETCISAIVKVFLEKGVAAVCGNLVYVSPENLGRVVRFYSSEGFKPHMFSFGIMPAHPSCFILRQCYEEYGLYKENYKIAADFELLLRFFKVHGVSYSCLPKILVKMRTGGLSTNSLKSNWILNKEILKACKENNIHTNFFKVFSKYLIKIFQLVQRPSQK